MVFLSFRWFSIGLSCDDVVGKEEFEIKVVIVCFYMWYYFKRVKGVFFFFRVGRGLSREG